MRTRLLLAAAGLLLSACSAPTSPAPTAPSPSPAVSPSPRPSPSPSPSAAPVRLTGDGIDTPERVVLFGDAFEDAQPVLVAALGEPTKDTGQQSSAGEYGVCPGSRLRALEFGDGALYVLFGDAIGPGMTMYQWRLTDDGRAGDVPQASALVGDVTTHEFAVGDTLASLRDGVQGSELEVFEANEPFPPAFRLTDQSAGFFGQLTGTGPTDTITAVQAGEGCGE